MMKEYYLVYNRILSSYIFYEGKSRHDSRREELGQQDPTGLTAALRQRLNFKRNTLLHVVDIPEEVIQRIEDLLEDTKVNIKIEVRERQAI